MLSQTKEVVSRLIAAGFERKEFSVRTPWDPQRCGYDEPRITIWDVKKALLLSGALLEHGFGVVHYVRDGEVRMVYVYPYSRKGNEVEVIDFSLVRCPTCGQTYERWKEETHRFSHRLKDK